MSIPATVALTGEEIDKAMHEIYYARIATKGPDSRLNLTPMAFSWTGGEVGKRHIYMWARGQKVVNLRRDPECSVIADDGESFARVRAVLLHCKGHVLEDAVAEDSDEHLTKARIELGKKYRVVGEGGGRSEEPWPGTARGKSWRWIRLEPHKIVTWDNKKITAPGTKARYGAQMLRGDKRE
jgi:hypothetical protein